MFLEKDSAKLKLFDQSSLRYGQEICLSDIPTPIGCPGGLLGGTIAKEVKEFGITSLDDADSKFTKLQFGPDDLLLPRRDWGRRSAQTNHHGVSEELGNDSNLKTMILDFCQAVLPKVVSCALNIGADTD